MKAKEIIGEGLGSLVGKGLVKLGSKLAGKGTAAAKAAAPAAQLTAAELKTAELAAELAALKAAKEPGIIRKAIGKGLKYGTIGSGIAGTSHYLTDPDKPTVGAAFGRGIADVADMVGKGMGFAKDFAGDVYKGATGADTATDAPGTTEPKQSSAKPASKEISYGEHPVPAPVPQDQLAEPTNDNYGSGNYVRDVERRVRQNFEKGVQSYEPGAGQQNEAVKKKFAIAEADNRSSFELEVEKNFSDPYVRKAIMAKARQESGGRNIGEKSYAGNTNDYIRKIFRGNPHLAKLSDAELSTLKKNSTAFYDVVYKDLGGSKYIGRGPIQITGKNNYARIDKDLGLNGALVKDPDMLLRDPALANAASVQYLKNSGLHKKTFNDQRAAHQEVIYSIGGPSYAPGSKRGNSVLAQIEKYGPTAVAGTTVAGVPKGSGAKPSTTAEKLPPGQLIQMPDLSMGYVVGDKFVPKTTQGTGAPVDYKQAYSQAASSGGISRAEAMRQANAELATLRGAPREPSRPVAEPSSVVPKPPVAPDTAKTPDSKSAPAYAQAYPTKSVVPAQDTGSWDKFINTVTVGRVPAEEKERMQVPESINKEIQDILRLSGKQ